VAPPPPDASPDAAGVWTDGGPVSLPAAAGLELHGALTVGQLSVGGHRRKTSEHRARSYWRFVLLLVRFVYQIR
jgi:hypothetical protein